MDRSSASDRIDEVLSKASKLVTPTAQEQKKLERIVEKIRLLLEESSSKQPQQQIRPEVIVGGSYAKGTWLRGEADVDFFLLYPPEYPRQKLETEAIELARNAVRRYNINMRFAEHPYVEAFVDSTRVDLVPCYRAEKGSWQSAVDRSPFHAEYIRPRFDEALRLQARLLKKFLKVGGVYGAEVKTQGVSGYMTEVLTLKFGSFKTTLEYLASYSPKEPIVSVEPYDKDYVSTSFSSPLIVLDPVDTTRNLGNALSIENVAKFCLRSRRFLSDPSLSFFSRSETSAKVGKATGKYKHALVSRTIVLGFRNESRSVDILWGQLRKSLNAISNKLKEHGFVVLRAAAASNDNDESAFLFLFLDTSLGEFQKRSGPEFFRRQEVTRYLTKNRGDYLISWIDELGRVTSVFERDPRSCDAKTFLKSILSDRKNLASVGLSKAIRAEIGRGEYSIRNGEDALRRIAKNKNSWMWLRTAIQQIISEEPEIVGI